MTSSLQAKKSNDRRCPPQTKVGAREARALGDKTRTKKRLLRWSSKLVFVVWRGNAQQLNVPLGAAARPERTTAPFAILCGSEPTVHTVRSRVPLRRSRRGRRQAAGPAGAARWGEGGQVGLWLSAVSGCRNIKVGEYCDARRLLLVSNAARVCPAT